MKNKEKQFLSTQAYQLIKEAIVTCELSPGQLIVQSDLAEMYGVGVTPVREALRRLGLEGFVIAVPRLGYQVSPITFQDIQEIFELRLVLECAAVRFASERATTEQLRKISESANFTYEYKKRDSYINFLQHNADFHILITSTSGNSRLIHQIRKIMDELHRVFHLGLDVRDSADEMRMDHIRISDALNNRDAELVEKLIRNEIVTSQERIFEALKEYQKNTAPVGFPNSAFPVDFKGDGGS